MGRKIKILSMLIVLLPDHPDLTKANPWRAALKERVDGR